MYFMKLGLLINTSSTKNLINNFINHHVSESKQRDVFPINLIIIEFCFQISSNIYHKNNAKMSTLNTGIIKVIQNI